MSVLRRIASWFKRLDKDLKGSLSYEDLAHELLEYADPCVFSDKTAMEVAMAIDINNSGNIQFTNFVAAIVSLDSEILRSTAPWIFPALAEDWAWSLDFHEVPKIMSEACGGRLQMGEVK